MKRRRLLLAGLALVAALAVAAVHLVSELLTREGPNYSLIEEGLYMGGDVSRPPRGTRAVLNLCEKEDAYDCEVHRWEPIRDVPPAPGVDWLQDMVAFIAANRQAGRTTYVHCRNGASRSGLVVVAYLMSEHGWTHDEALAFARLQRPVVRPNPAFLSLLQEWERVVRGGGR
jgi:hypothetical protein